MTIGDPQALEPYPYENWKETADAVLEHIYGESTDSLPEGYILPEKPLFSEPELADGGFYEHKFDELLRFYEKDEHAGEGKENWYGAEMANAVILAEDLPTAQEGLRHFSAWIETHVLPEFFEAETVSGHPADDIREDILNYTVRNIVSRNYLVQNHIRPQEQVVFEKAEDEKGYLVEVEDDEPSIQEYLSRSDS